MTPRTLYRRIAVAEVVTWALLLLGMVLKYVTKTTDLGVRVFGLVHGVVFIAFCLVTVLLWVHQRWSVREGVLGLLSAVPPFLTVWWERRLGRRGRLDGGWRFGPAADSPDTPTTPAERVVALLLARPALAVAIGAAAVVALTSLALAVGPPASTS
ncbi:MAG: rane protein [Humibacillus sp.]|nr:rane protein [Humibacillus sp.]